jgi:DNA-binding transcriptional regulator YiaG
MPPDTGTMAPLGAELEPMTPQEMKAWRAAHGDMSQSALARHLEVSLGTIRKYEQGERKIPAFMWRALRDLAAELKRRHRSTGARDAAAQ